MEVENFSKEWVRPSSPTPSFLRTYKISLLDQFIPSICIPLILYYPCPTQDTDIALKRSLLLKQSLSETLAYFYPFAGKVKDNFSIDCDDEGVYYVEARANISLSEYLKQPDLPSMNKLIPVEASLQESTPGSHVAMIQETTFACGGFTIGVLVSHIVSDGTTLSSFLKAWAAIACKSSNEIVCPNFDGPSIFLQHDAFPKEVSMIAFTGPFFRKMKGSTRRILFDGSSIASLQMKATSLNVKNPTRVEVVTAFLSKCLMGIFNKPLAITHAVNLRRRAVPPFPEFSIGNFLWLAAALFTLKEIETEIELSSIVQQMREAIGKINDDTVKKLQGDGGFHELCGMVKEASGELARAGFISGAEYVSFTSWCNFGLYEVDFGWGKPVWTTSVGSNNSEIMFVNSVVLMDARKDKGIEAWMFLDEADILRLEKDEELLQYAFIDPCPLS